MLGDEQYECQGTLRCATEFGFEHFNERSVSPLTTHAFGGEAFVSDMWFGAVLGADIPNIAEVYEAKLEEDARRMACSFAKHGHDPLPALLERYEGFIASTRLTNIAVEASKEPKAIPA